MYNLYRCSDERIVCKWNICMWGVVGCVACLHFCDTVLCLVRRVGTSGEETSIHVERHHRNYSSCLKACLYRLRIGLGVLSKLEESVGRRNVSRRIVYAAHWQRRTGSESRIRPACSREIWTWRRNLDCLIENGNDFVSSFIGGKRAVYVGGMNGTFLLHVGNERNFCFKGRIQFMSKSISFWWVAKWEKGRRVGGRPKKVRVSQRKGETSSSALALLRKQRGQ